VNIALRDNSLFPQYFQFWYFFRSNRCCLSVI